MPLPTFESRVRGKLANHETLNLSPQKPPLRALNPDTHTRNRDPETLKPNHYKAMKLERPPPRMFKSPSSLKSRTNVAKCSGCGVRLQSRDPNAVGYVYTRTDAHSVRVAEWEKKTLHDIYNAVLADCDDVMTEKLQNTDEATRALEEEAKKEVSTQGQDKLRRQVQPLLLDRRMSYTVPPQLKKAGVPALTGVPNDEETRSLCLRCHELRHHSNPFPNINNTVPPAPTPAQLLDEIASSAHVDPPLFVIVLDPVDFPLCFFPFWVPRGGKVLFVVNRADSFCERASAMKHLRQYFYQQIAAKLKEMKIQVETWEVHCVSVKKLYGFKECLDALIRLRSRHGNVYFLGYPHSSGDVELTRAGYTNVGKSSVIGGLLGEAGYAHPNVKRPKIAIVANQSSEEKTLEFRRLAPTASRFPHTTMSNVEIPWQDFTKYLQTPEFEKQFQGAPEGWQTGTGVVVDTPGFDEDHTFLQSFIDEEYELNMSLTRVGGFQRPADKMRAGILKNSVPGANAFRTIDDPWRPNPHRFTRSRPPPPRTHGPTHPHHRLYKSHRTPLLPPKSRPRPRRTTLLLLRPPLPNRNRHQPRHGPAHESGPRNQGPEHRQLGAEYTRGGVCGAGVRCGGGQFCEGEGAGVDAGGEGCGGAVADRTGDWGRVFVGCGEEAKMGEVGAVEWPEEFGGGVAGQVFGG